MTPSVNDVLCGRGGVTNAHPGNETFRQLVDRRKRVYLTARIRREKRLIAEAIVKEIRSLDPPGRFLTRDDETGGWCDIGDEKARDKTSQALRENAPVIRREINEENCVIIEQRNKAAAMAEAGRSSRPPDERIAGPCPPPYEGGYHGGPPPSPAWIGYHGYHVAPLHNYGNYPAPMNTFDSRQQAYPPPPPHYRAYPPQPQRLIPHPPKMVTSAPSNVPGTFNNNFCVPATSSMSPSSPTPGPQNPLLPPLGSRPHPGAPIPNHNSRDAHHPGGKSATHESSSNNAQSTTEARSPAIPVPPYPHHDRLYNRTVNGLDGPRALPHYGRDPRATASRKASKKSILLNRQKILASIQLDPNRHDCAQGKVPNGSTEVRRRKVRFAGSMKPDCCDNGGSNAKGGSRETRCPSTPPLVHVPHV